MEETADDGASAREYGEQAAPIPALVSSDSPTALTELTGSPCLAHPPVPCMSPQHPHLRTAVR